MYIVHIIAFSFFGTFNLCIDPFLSSYVGKSINSLVWVTSTPTYLQLFLSENTGGNKIFIMIGRTHLGKYVMIIVVSYVLIVRMRADDHCVAERLFKRIMSKHCPHELCLSFIFTWVERDRIGCYPLLSSFSWLFQTLSFWFIWSNSSSPTISQVDKHWINIDKLWCCRFIKLLIKSKSLSSSCCH